MKNISEKKLSYYLWLLGNFIVELKECEVALEALLHAKKSCYRDSTIKAILDFVNDELMNIDLDNPILKIIRSYQHGVYNEEETH